METGILLCIFTILQCLTNICADTVVTLLKVDAGTGVSFIDLWNMTGTSVGNETDSVYRNGILDNEFKTDCLKKLHIKLYGSSFGYGIIYQGSFNSSALASWITNPTYTSYSTPPGNIRIVVTPSEDIIFKMSDKTNPNDLHLAVYYPSNVAPYPKYYHVEDENPQTGPIPANENKFISAEILQIRGRYDDGCDLVDHNSVQSSFDDAIRVLQGSNETTSFLTESTEMSTSKMEIIPFTTDKDDLLSGTSVSTIVPSTTEELTTAEQTDVASIAVDKITMTEEQTTVATMAETKSTIETNIYTIMESNTESSSTTKAGKKTCTFNNHETNMYFKQSFDNEPTISRSVEVWNKESKSLITCAIMCMQDRTNCKSFYYTDEGTCIGLQHTNNADNKPTSAKHYKLESC